jgi:hypothetical protein
MSGYETSLWPAFVKIDNLVSEVSPIASPLFTL